MAKQQFHQPNRNRRGGVYDDDGVAFTPPSAVPGSSGISSNVSANAQKTIDDIDDLLREGEQQPSLYNPQGDSSVDTGDASEGTSSTDKKGLSPKELLHKENQGGKEAAEMMSAAKGLASANPIGMAIALGKTIKAAKKYKKSMAGAGIGAVLAGLLVALLMSLLPLKVMNIIDNLEEGFFAASSEAASEMGHHLMKAYLVEHVIPGMVKNNCSSTRVSRSCADVRGTNIVSALYLAHRDANLEGRMAERYGLEIARDGRGHFLVRSNALNQELDLGTYDPANTRDFNGRAFAVLDRTEIRRQMQIAVEGETYSRRARFISMRSLIARKYGVRFCVTACTQLDRVQSSLEAKQSAAKAYFAERVLYPRSAAMGLALDCALGGFTCATFADEPDSYGEQHSEYDNRLRERLREFRALHGTTSLTELDTNAREIQSKGFVEFAIKQIAGETVSKVAVKIIPVIGWVDFGATVVAAGATAGPAIVHMNYVMNSTTMAQTYAMYSTHSDEIRTGNVDAAIVASMASSFDANPENDQGGGSAESTPLYPAVMEGCPVQTAQLMNTLLPSAHAAGTADTKHLCDDGNAVPLAQFICSEVGLGATSTVGDILTHISDVFNNPGLLQISQLAGLWVDAVNRIISAIIGIFPNITPQQVEDVIAWVKDNVFAKILVNPVSDRMSGGRTFEVVAGGAAVSGAEFAHYGQGGQVLTDGQVATIQAKQRAERLAEFDRLPTYDKIFAKDNTLSLVSQIAVSLPSSHASGLQTVSRFASNPIGTFSSLLGPVFGGQKAHAGVVLTPRIYGVEPHGYLPDDPVFQGDPIEYWDANDCGNPDNMKNWGRTAVLNEQIQQKVHNQTNGCKLLRNEIGNMGGIYNTDLLEKDVVLAAPAPPAGPGNPTDVFGPSDTMTCAAGTDGGVQDGYRDGTLVKIRLCIINGIDVNAKIAANVDALLKAAAAQGIVLTGGGFRTMDEQRRLYAGNCPGGKCDPATARPGYSNHQMGLAIDFRYNNATICFVNTLSAAECRAQNTNAGFKWLDANAGNYSLINFPKEAWHWSVDGT